MKREKKQGGAEKLKKLADYLEATSSGCILKETFSFIFSAA